MVKVPNNQAFFQMGIRRLSRLEIGSVKTVTSVARFMMPKTANTALWLPQCPPRIDRSQLYAKGRQIRTELRKPDVPSSATKTMMILAGRQIDVTAKTLT